MMHAGLSTSPRVQDGRVYFRVCSYLRLVIATQAEWL